MKKIAFKLAGLALSSSLLLAGCSGANSNTSSNSSDSGKLKVYTSFYPMYDFAKKIGGDKVEVENLVPAGVEPHDWEPSTKDIAKLGESNVFIYNGAGMESWVEKLDGTFKEGKVSLVEASKGVKLIEAKESDHHEEGHEDGKHEDGKHEDGKHEDEHSHEHEGKYDPHTWLDPENAKIEMNNIKDAFIKADPKNKDTYEKNYQDNARKLDELNKKFKDSLSNTKKKEVVVSHSAFAYMLNKYGINQLGIEGLSPDSEPDASRMAEITKFAKEHDVKYIFFEELVNPKVSETIAKEVGAKTEVLNPLEGLTDKQVKDGEDYFSIMNKNLEVLIKALN